MSFGSNVAPPKIPLRPKPTSWRCMCPADTETPSNVIHPGYIANCTACGSRRPS